MRKCAIIYHAKVDHFYDAKIFRSCHFIKEYYCQLEIDINPFFFADHLGPVVQKPINTNPGLKVNQAFNFSCIKVFFSANVL